MQDFAGARCADARQKIKRGAGDAFHARVFFQQRPVATRGHQLAAAGDAGHGEGFHWPCGNRVDADAFGPEIARDVAHRGFERRLRDAHDIVVRHDSFRSERGEGDHRAAVRHHMARPPGGVDERERRHVHSVPEILARGVFDEGAFEGLLVGEGDGVDEKVDLAPLVLDFAEGPFHVVVAHHVSLNEELDADGFGELAHPAFHGADIGEAKLRALGVQLLGDAPGDGDLVGDAHDEAALALHQIALRVGDVAAHALRP